MSLSLVLLCTAASCEAGPEAVEVGSGALEKAGAVLAGPEMKVSTGAGSEIARWLAAGRKPGLAAAQGLRPADQLLLEDGALSSLRGLPALGDRALPAAGEGAWRALADPAATSPELTIPDPELVLHLPGGTPPQADQWQLARIRPGSAAQEARNAILGSQGAAPSAGARAPVLRELLSQDQIGLLTQDLPPAQAAALHQELVVADGMIRSSVLTAVARAAPDASAESIVRAAMEQLARVAPGEQASAAAAEAPARAALDLSEGKLEIPLPRLGRLEMKPLRLDVRSAITNGVSTCMAAGGVGSSRGRLGRCAAAAAASLLLPGALARAP